MRIIIFENDTEALIQVADHLENLGYDVICCDNQEFVSDFLRLNHADLLMIDVDHDDEINLVKELKCCLESSSLKIFAITENYEKGYLKVSNYVEDTLQRPIDLDDLNSRIVAYTYES